MRSYASESLSMTMWAEEGMYDGQFLAAILAVGSSRRRE